MSGNFSTEIDSVEFPSARRSPYFVLTCPEGFRIDWSYLNTVSSGGRFLRSSDTETLKSAIKTKVHAAENSRNSMFALQKEKLGVNRLLERSVQVQKHLSSLATGYFFNF